MSIDGHKVCSGSLRRSFGVLLAAVFVAMTFALTACSQEKDELRSQGLRFFKLSDISGHEFLNDYSGSDDAYLCEVEGFEGTELTIPSEVDGIPVVAVTSDIAGNSSLKKLTISEGIQFVDHGFNNYTALESVSFPSTLRGIYDKCFGGCALKSLDFPSALNMVSGFNNCSDLETVTFHGYVEEIEMGAFRSCTSLVSVNYESGHGTVSDQAFYDCPLLGGGSTPETSAVSTEPPEQIARDLPILVPEADDPDMTDNEWGQALFNDAIGKMFDAGEITPSSIGEQHLFAYDSTGNILFTSDGSRARYMDDPVVIDGPVIWGAYDAVSVSVFNKPEIQRDEVEGEPEMFAHYYEAPSYAAYMRVADLSYDSFADTRGQCKYFIVMVSVYSNVEEAFYINDVDRISRATEVFVIDAVNREVVHIEHIGNDVPGSVDSSSIGDIMMDEAFEYMNTISGDYSGD